MTQLKNEGIGPQINSEIREKKEKKPIVCDFTKKPQPSLSDLNGSQTQDSELRNNLNRLWRKFVGERGTEISKDDIINQTIEVEKNQEEEQREKPLETSEKSPKLKNIIRHDYEPSHLQSNGSLPLTPEARAKAFLEYWIGEQFENIHVFANKETNDVTWAVDEKGDDRGFLEKIDKGLDKLLGVDRSTDQQTIEVNGLQYDRVEREDALKRVEVQLMKDFDTRLSGVKLESKEAFAYRVTIDDRSKEVFGSEENAFTQQQDPSSPISSKLRSELRIVGKPEDWGEKIPGLGENVKLPELNENQAYECIYSNGRKITIERVGLDEIADEVERKEQYLSKFAKEIWGWENLHGYSVNGEPVEYYPSPESLKKALGISSEDLAKIERGENGSYIGKGREKFKIEYIGLYKMIEEMEAGYRELSDHIKEIEKKFDNRGIKLEEDIKNLPLRDRFQTMQEQYISGFTKECFGSEYKESYLYRDREGEIKSAKSPKERNNLKRQHKAVELSEEKGEIIEELEKLQKKKIDDINKLSEKFSKRGIELEKGIEELPLCDKLQKMQEQYISKIVVEAKGEEWEKPHGYKINDKIQIYPTAGYMGGDAGISVEDLNKIENGKYGTYKGEKSEVKIEKIELNELIEKTEEKITRCKQNIEKLEEKLSNRGMTLDKYEKLPLLDKMQKMQMDYIDELQNEIWGGKKEAPYSSVVDGKLLNNLEDTGLDERIEQVEKELSKYKQDIEKLEGKITLEKDINGLHDKLQELQDRYISKLGTEIWGDEWGEKSYPLKIGNDLDIELGNLEKFGILESELDQIQQGKPIVKDGNTIERADLDKAIELIEENRKSTIMEIEKEKGNLGIKAEESINDIVGDSESLHDIWKKLAKKYKVSSKRKKELIESHGQKLYDEEKELPLHKQVDKLEKRKKLKDKENEKQQGLADKKKEEIEKLKRENQKENQKIERIKEHNKNLFGDEVKPDKPHVFEYNNKLYYHEKLEPSTEELKLPLEGSLAEKSLADLITDEHVKRLSLDEALGKLKADEVELSNRKEELEKDLGLTPGDEGEDQSLKEQVENLKELQKDNFDKIKELGKKLFGEEGTYVFEDEDKQLHVTDNKDREETLASGEAIERLKNLKTDTINDIGGNEKKLTGREIELGENSRIFECEGELYYKVEDLVEALKNHGIAVTEQERATLQTIEKMGDTFKVKGGGETEIKVTRDLPLRKAAERHLSKHRERIQALETKRSGRTFTSEEVYVFKIGDELHITDKKDPTSTQLKEELKARGLDVSDDDLATKEKLSLEDGETRLKALQKEKFKPIPGLEKKFSGRDIDLEANYVFEHNNRLYYHKDLNPTTEQLGLLSTKTLENLITDGDVKRVPVEQIEGRLQKLQKMKIESIQENCTKLHGMKVEFSEHNDKFYITDNITSEEVKQSLEDIDKKFKEGVSDHEKRLDKVQRELEGNKGKKIYFEIKEGETKKDETREGTWYYGDLESLAEKLKAEDKLTGMKVGETKLIEIGAEKITIRWPGLNETVERLEGLKGKAIEILQENETKISGKGFDSKKDCGFYRVTFDDKSEPKLLRVFESLEEIKKKFPELNDKLKEGGSEKINGGEIKRLGLIEAANEWPTELADLEESIQKLEKKRSGREIKLGEVLILEARDRVYCEKPEDMAGVLKNELGITVTEAELTNLRQMNYECAVQNDNKNDVIVKHPALDRAREILELRQKISEIAVKRWGPKWANVRSYSIDDKPFHYYTGSKHLAEELAGKYKISAEDLNKIKNGEYGTYHEEGGKGFTIRERDLDTLAEKLKKGLSDDMQEVQKSEKRFSGRTVDAKKNYVFEYEKRLYYHENPSPTKEQLGLSSTKTLEKLIADGEVKQHLLESVQGRLKELQNDKTKSIKDLERKRSGREFGSGKIRVFEIRDSLYVSEADPKLEDVQKRFPDVSQADLANKKELSLEEGQARLQMSEMASERWGEEREKVSCGYEIVCNGRSFNDYHVKLDDITKFYDITNDDPDKRKNGKSFEAKAKISTEYHEAGDNVEIRLLESYETAARMEKELSEKRRHVEELEKKISGRDMQWKDIQSGNLLVLEAGDKIYREKREDMAKVLKKELGITITVEELDQELAKLQKVDNSWKGKDEENKDIVVKYPSVENIEEKMYNQYIVRMARDHWRGGKLENVTCSYEIIPENSENTVTSYFTNLDKIKDNCNIMDDDQDKRKNGEVFKGIANKSVKVGKEILIKEGENVEIRLHKPHETAERLEKWLLKTKVKELRGQDWAADKSRAYVVTVNGERSLHICENETDRKAMAEGLIPSDKQVDLGKVGYDYRNTDKTIEVKCLSPYETLEELRVEEIKGLVKNVHGRKYSKISGYMFNDQFEIGQTSEEVAGRYPILKGKEKELAELEMGESRTFVEEEKKESSISKNLRKVGNILKKENNDNSTPKTFETKRLNSDLTLEKMYERKNKKSALIKEIVRHLDPQDLEDICNIKDAKDFTGWKEIHGFKVTVDGETKLRIDKSRQDIVKRYGALQGKEKEIDGIEEDQKHTIKGKDNKKFELISLSLDVIVRELQEIRRQPILPVKELVKELGLKEICNNDKNIDKWPDVHGFKVTIDGQSKSLIAKSKDALADYEVFEGIEDDKKEELKDQLRGMNLGDKKDHTIQINDKDIKIEYVELPVISQELKELKDIRGLVKELGLKEICNKKDVTEWKEIHGFKVTIDDQTKSRIAGQRQDLAGYEDFKGITPAEKQKLEKKLNKMNSSDNKSTTTRVNDKDIKIEYVELPVIVQELKEMEEIVGLVKELGLNGKNLTGNEDITTWEGIHVFKVDGDRKLAESRQAMADRWGVTKNDKEKLVKMKEGDAPVVIKRDGEQIKVEYLKSDEIKKELKEEEKEQIKDIQKIWKDLYGDNITSKDSTGKKIEPEKLYGYEIKIDGKEQKLSKKLPVFENPKDLVKELKAKGFEISDQDAEIKVDGEPIGKKSIDNSHSIEIKRIGYDGMKKKMEEEQEEVIKDLAKFLHINAESVNVSKPPRAYKVNDGKNGESYRFATNLDIFVDRLRREERYPKLKMTKDELAKVEIGQKKTFFQHLDKGKKSFDVERIGLAIGRDALKRKQQTKTNDLKKDLKELGPNGIYVGGGDVNSLKEAYACKINGQLFVAKDLSAMAKGRGIPEGELYKAQEHRRNGKKEYIYVKKDKNGNEVKNENGNKAEVKIEHILLNKARDEVIIKKNNVIDKIKGDLEGLQRQEIKNVYVGEQRISNLKEVHGFLVDGKLRIAESPSVLAKSLAIDVKELNELEIDGKSKKVGSIEIKSISLTETDKKLQEAKEIKKIQNDVKYDMEEIKMEEALENELGRLNKKDITENMRITYELTCLNDMDNWLVFEDQDGNRFYTNSAKKAADHFFGGKHKEDIFNLKEGGTFREGLFGRGKQIKRVKMTKDLIASLRRPNVEWRLPPVYMYKNVTDKKIVVTDNPAFVMDKFEAVEIKEGEREIRLNDWFKLKNTRDHVDVRDDNDVEDNDGPTEENEDKVPRFWEHTKLGDDNEAIFAEFRKDPEAQEELVPILEEVEDLYEDMKDENITKETKQRMEQYRLRKLQFAENEKNEEIKEEAIKGMKKGLEKTKETLVASHFKAFTDTAEGKEIGELAKVWLKLYRSNYGELKDQIDLEKSIKSQVDLMIEYVREKDGNQKKKLINNWERSLKEENKYIEEEFGGSKFFSRIKNSNAPKPPIFSLIKGY